MARRTTRRKGPRTGAIEVPETLFRRIWRDVEAAFVEVPVSHETRLLRDIFGEPVEEHVSLLPVKRQFAAGVAAFLPEKYKQGLWYHVDVGTYDLPSIRPRSVKVPVSVVISDPVRGGSLYAGSGSGALVMTTEVVELSAAAQKRSLKATLDALGLPRSSLRGLGEEERDLLCRYEGGLGYTVVLRVEFERTFLKKRLFRVLKTTLRHELAHAFDEGIRARDQRTIEADNHSSCRAEVQAAVAGVESTAAHEEVGGELTEGDPEWTAEQWSTYYNLPVEVAARLTEAVPQLAMHVTDLGLRLDETEGPIGAVVMQWALDWSRALAGMWPHLSDQNQRRVMRAVYDMARYDIEDAMRGRPAVLPNRRRR